MQHQEFNFDLDNTQSSLELVNIKLLEWDVLVDSFNDSKFFGRQIFQELQ